MSQPMEEERRVVPFAALRKRARRRPAEEAEGRGVILLFTGVRYERMGQPSSAASSRPGKREASASGN